MSSAARTESLCAASSTTAKLQDAAKLLGVAMLDHIILGSPSAKGGGFTSLAELSATD